MLEKEKDSKGPHYDKGRVVVSVRGSKSNYPRIAIAKPTQKSS